ncbi:TetR/AcrR family transcriptional regulator [Lacisediminihabitans profunda]|uniref:Helix-turn-helix transcriptional regulator n=1 Tax=Lacisediminihabitans profunda TaxID=2594790 RepID=A0A5C8USD8_9MICO|nr:TetR/AcrR family transcriptional regulator [Lacisediminihabitans profunda]TXN31511.1 helix-turn-helix transcriptional regulator [Lacisediminihabitans profunda]
MADAPAEQATERSRAKADRRDALLAAAARLFAARGFNGVSIEDLGSAVGISGPAVYRHFSGKQSVLAALLVGVSEDLLAGGLAVVDAAANDPAALRALIRFHTDFALSNPEVIRVQDRDLESLADEDSHAVRTLQRRYVELWVGVLARLSPGEDTAVLRMRAHATFGLLNSTPHSSSRSLPRSTMHDELEKMAWALLG